MRTPIFVRSLSEEEREELEAGLRSKSAFTMRRSQILLASARGEHAPKIARSLGCAPQTARDAIHDFNERSMDALRAKSSRPERTREAFDQEGAEALRQMLHLCPREFGYESSLWTLGFEDECWWSRVALPAMSAWAEDGSPKRLFQQSVADDDPDPKAISCYGLYLPKIGDTWVRFVDGRPVSSITTQFL